MDDDKKTPQGLNDNIDEHELDIDVPDDLKPVKDVNLSDTQAESLSIFDQFDDTNDFGEFEKAPEREESMDKKPEEPLFDESVFGGRTFDEDLFKEDFKIEESPDEPLTNRSPVHDEDLFASDAFEDVNSQSSNLDFPEGETGSKLGDSQLFDYEPGTSGAEESVSSEAMYAAPSPGGGGDKGGKKPGVPEWFKSRRTVRVVMMVVLVGAVYGILRLFTGSHETNVGELATAPVVHPPQAIEGHKPEHVQAANEMAPQTPAPMAPAPEHAAITPPVASEVTAPAPMALAPAAAAATPAAPLSPNVTALPTPQQQMAGGGQGPQASLPVPAPNTSLPAQAGASTHPQAPAAPNPMPSDQIASKLSSLEASIMAIDDRLSTIAQNKTGAKSNEGISSISAFGKAAPEAQEVMIETLQDIDKKMSHLAELQSQVHILNKEVSALKNDVVQQSIIVGQNQAQINQNLVSHLETVVPKMIVQAAIPGRAWLRSETGQLMTVIPGDEVPGYGRVVSIDPTTGTVVMSSRAVFREQ